MINLLIWDEMSPVTRTGIWNRRQVRFMINLSSKKGKKWVSAIIVAILCIAMVISLLVAAI
jgi:hypothetical protein